MSTSAVARNYAATLLELADRDSEADRYAELIEIAGRLSGGDDRLSRFLDAPSVTMVAKKAALRKVFEPVAPEIFVRFLLVVLDRGRHAALPGIAEAYRDLLDERAGRVRAEVTLPFEAGPEVRSDIVDALERRFKKDVVAEFHMDPRIVGGLIVRVGDELADGSIRRGLKSLRRELA